MLNQRTGTTSRRAQARGFSLLELLLVLLIIGILSSVAAYNFLGEGERARVKATQAQLATLKKAVESYQFSSGQFPTVTQGVQILVPSYVEQKAVFDPWGSRIEYYYPTSDPNRPFDLVSAGPDKAMGTGDDITLWGPTGTVQ